MNKIELILENSIFNVNQFDAGQIAALNEMAVNIPSEQVGIIAHPSVNELTYSVLYDYLSKGNSITSVEYQKYINIDLDRINAIIINVYLGKLHGLSDELISLYAQKSVFNIKIARLLVEKSKDLPTEQLEQLVIGKFSSGNIVGKMAIQDYINNELSLEQLLTLTYCDKLTQDNYEYIKQQTDSRLLSILKNYFKEYKPEIALQKSYYIKQSYNIDNYFECITDGANDTFKNAINNGHPVHFDSIDTYHRFKELFKENLDKTPNEMDKMLAEYKYEISFSSSCFKLENIERLYYYDCKESEVKYLKTNDDVYHNIIYLYYHNDTIFYDRNNSDNRRTYKDEFPTLDEFCTVCADTNGFKDYVQAKYIDKVSDEELNLIKQGKSTLEILYSLYKTKKDKETEIPYLEEHLKDATAKQINEVICMKKNKCSNDEIHLFIEKYLSCTKCLPTMYYNNDYNKYFSSISEFLQLNDIDNMKLDDIVRLKEAKCTDEEIQYCCTHNIGVGSDPVQRELLSIIMKNNWSSFYITETDDITKITIDNYNFAVANFKNKPKSIERIVAKNYSIEIKPHLLKYIDNFDDDTFSKIIDNDYESHFINFCLKMSSISIDYKILRKMYDDIDTNKEIDDFADVDEKVTKDVVIKFCKKAKIDVPKDLFEDQIENVIEKSVDYFGSSKNFKPIQYDDETIYVDIVGNKELKGNHIITFNKEENNDYEYIFEIAHKEDTLTYTSKIATKKDVTEAINKSIALIENIDEYKEYVEELQEMLKSI